MKRISLSGIYGAPTVVTIFGPKNCLYSVPDAFCAEIHSVLSKKFFKKNTDSKCLISNNGYLYVTM